ncbi:hypothetical protein BDZ89DRAFT_1143083 [Hymenopellis radicata]|nr:hypothetical protein BDZ89DRAFT_1143083 [Hymenopellis radicata]
MSRSTAHTSWQSHQAGLNVALQKFEQKVRDQDQELLNTKKELQKLQNERHQALAQTNTPETHGDTQLRYEELRLQLVALQKDHQGEFASLQGDSAMTASAAMRDEHDLCDMKISEMRKSLKTVLIDSPDDARSLVAAVNMQLSMLEELDNGRLSLEVGKGTTGSVNGNTCPDLDVEGEGSARKKRKNMHTGF